MPSEYMQNTLGLGGEEEKDR